MEDKFWIGAFWNRLIYPGSCSDDAVDPAESTELVWKSLLRERFPDYVACVCLDDFGEGSAAGDKAMLSAVEGCICSVLGEEQRRLLGMAHHNSLYLCGFCDVSEDPHIGSDLIRRLRTVISQMAECGISTTIGLAFLPSESFRAWEWAAQRAVVAQRRKVNSGKGRLYVFTDDVIVRPPVKAYKELTEELWQLVAAGDLRQADSAADHVRKRLFEDEYLPLHHLRLMLQAQITTMGWAAVTSGVDESEVFDRVQEFMSSTDNLYDYAKLRALACEAVYWFTSAVHGIVSRRYSPVVRSALAFIDARIEDPVSLRDAASALNIAPSYLSRRFKGETGMTVTDYIQHKRVEKAKRLLDNGGLAIGEIAYSVGFGSIQHFQRVFKKILGDSPSAFRRSKSVHSKPDNV